MRHPEEVRQFYVVADTRGTEGGLHCCWRVFIHPSAEPVDLELLGPVGRQECYFLPAEAYLKFVPKAVGGTHLAPLFTANSTTTHHVPVEP